MKIFIILFGFFLHMSASAQLCIEGDCQNKNGTMIKPDGSKYTGSFVNGKSHGQGVLEYRNGDKYEGLFSEGLPHGYGTYSWSNGDVYEGIDAHTLEDNKIDIMQKKLRILSGLYGILKPLDLIQPYRLEMGTKLSVGNSSDLYQFWKKKVTDNLVNELERNELLVNLASKEYFSVVDTKVIKSPIVSPEFKDFKNGKLKIISFYAKKARGMMARYLIEKNAKSLDDINSFEISGYRLSNEETINKFNPVFIR